MLGEDPKTLAHRGLAKVLEDRAEFEMVADVPPESCARRSSRPPPPSGCD